MAPDGRDRTTEAIATLPRCLTAAGTRASRGPTRRDRSTIFEFACQSPASKTTFGSHRAAFLSATKVFRSAEPRLRAPVRELADSALTPPDSKMSGIEKVGSVGQIGKALLEAICVAKPDLPFSCGRRDCHSARVNHALANFATAKAAWTPFHTLTFDVHRRPSIHFRLGSCTARSIARRMKR
jgi:hypothetical protein